MRPPRNMHACTWRHVINALGILLHVGKISTTGGVGGGVGGAGVGAGLWVLSGSCRLRGLFCLFMSCCFWNFWHALDATFFWACSWNWNFWPPLDSTLLTCSWNFWDALDATHFHMFFKLLRRSWCYKYASNMFLKLAMLFDMFLELLTPSRCYVFLTCSWNFWHPLDATCFWHVLGTSDTLLKLRF